MNFKLPSFLIFYTLLPLALNAAQGTRLPLVPELFVRDSLSVSSDGRCGLLSQTTCSDSIYGSCCSAQNWCGFTDVYCLDGCQSGFGECGSEHVLSENSSASSASTSTTTSSTSTTFTTATTATESSNAPTESSVSTESSNTATQSLPTTTPTKTTVTMSGTPSPSTTKPADSNDSSSGLSKTNTIITTVVAVVGLPLTLLTTWAAWRHFKSRRANKAFDDLSDINSQYNENQNIVHSSHTQPPMVQTFLGFFHIQPGR